jgi:hypothetical protein
MPNKVNNDDPVTRAEPARERRALHFASVNWPRNLLIVALFTEGWLIFLHLRLAYNASATDSVLGQAFDFTRESSLPTYIGCVIALGVSIAALLVHLLKEKRENSKLSKYGWLVAAALFAIISFDDAIGMHERIGAITSLELMEKLSYPGYPWHITFAPFIGGGLLAVVFLIWRDVRSIPGLASMLILALFCYIAAFGCDVIEGFEKMVLTRGIAPVEANPQLPLLMLTEEVLEMAATSLFLYTIFSYLLALANGTKFSVSNQPVTVGEEVPVRKEADCSIA